MASGERSDRDETAMKSGYRLPLGARFLYASGSLGSQAVLQGVVLWAIFFYAPPAGDGRDPLLPIGLAGALVFLSRTVDVVSDPLVGFWSDRVTTRWGRRIPFILLGAPVMLLGFILIWTPPAGLPTGLTAAYMLFALSLFFIGHTISGRPYDALLPEMAPGSRERVNISAYRVFLGTCGAAVGLTLSGLLVEQYGFVVMGVVLGLVGLATRYTAVAGAWHWARRDVAPVRLGIFQSMVLSLRNRPFRYYLISFIVFSMALTMLTQLIPFHVSTVLGRGEAMVALVTGVFLALVLLSLPLVALLTGRTSKAFVFKLGLLATTVMLPLLFFVGFLPFPAPLVQVLAAVALLGVAMSPCFVLPTTLMADVIDHDEDVSGHRREAIYYGTEQGIQKMGIGFAALVFTQVLEIFGQTPEEPLGLRLIGPLAAVMVLVGFLIFARGYQLDPRRE